MKPPIVIRADASPSIGLGHVMRTATLARHLLSLNFDIYYISKMPTCQNCLNIANFNFPIKTLEPDTDENDQVIAYLKETMSNIIIIDSYTTNAESEEKISKQSGASVIVFDDNFAHHFCHLLINQNIYAHPSSYKGLVPESATLFAGCSYAFFRDEFYKNTPAMPKNVSSPNILITLGGADPDNHTLRVLNALKKLQATYRATVVLGGANKHIDAIKQHLSHTDADITLVVNADNMAVLMANADICITSASTTALEAAFMRLPIIALTIAENQLLVARSLQENGYAEVLNKKVSLSEESILHTLTKLVKTPEIARTLQRNVASLESGNKCVQLIDAIHCLYWQQLAIRKASAKDMMAVYKLSNEPYVRQQSFQSKTITLDEHKQWYTAQINNNQTYFFLLTDKYDRFLGQVRFAAESNRSFTISISLSSRLRGCKRSVAALKLAEQKLATSLGKTADIYAHIKRSNHASIKAFTNAGYILSDDSSSDKVIMLKKGNE